MRKPIQRRLKWYLKLVRHSGTPESVGRGVAVGMFSAFITPIGQMPLALLLAWPFRAAKGTALLSTWITNPFTMPVLYSAQCYLGGFIIGHPLSYEKIKPLILDVLHSPSLKTAWILGGDLLFSFIAGGVMFGVVMATLGYSCTLAVVRRHRARLAHRKERRIHLFKLKGHKT
ncbi:MAG: DUF2062 domain-containing protein [Kiritimatiellaceae bacterium]|nr:DUF2062 domain-containing protein [Kiritimatiellaceae bacterium]